MKPLAALALLASALALAACGRFEGGSTAGEPTKVQPAMSTVAAVP